MLVEHCVQIGERAGVIGIGQQAIRLYRRVDSVQLVRRWSVARPNCARNVGAKLVLGHWPIGGAMRDVAMKVDIEQKDGAEENLEAIGASNLTRLRSSPSTHVS